MSYNGPIKLAVANRQDFSIPMGLLMLLAVLAALLSPQPALLVVLILATGLGIFTLGFSKVNDSKLTLVIFEDGHAGIESAHKDTIEGFLGGQQWCTHHVAVLCVADGVSKRRLVILSAQQREADEFRRLNMWLRQDICCDTREKQVSRI